MIALGCSNHEAAVGDGGGDIEERAVVAQLDDARGAGGDGSCRRRRASETSCRKQSGGSLPTANSTVGPGRGRRRPGRFDFLAESGDIDRLDRSIESGPVRFLRQRPSAPAVIRFLVRVRISCGFDATGRAATIGVAAVHSAARSACLCASKFSL